jgi:hypothetical protein
VAADCLIGDHGSVTFYAAAIGVPVLLGAFGASEVARGTPIEVFGERAPQLCPHLPTRAQLEATGFDWDPGRYSDLVERAFANPGLALRTLRGVIYESIELDPPRRPPRVLPVPLPTPQQQLVTAHLVVASFADASGLRVDLERYPACLEPGGGDAHSCRHLAVDDREPDIRLRETAAVVVRGDAPWCLPGNELNEAVQWVSSTLAKYPGSRIAAALVSDGHFVVGARGGPVVEASTIAEVPNATALSASAAYACLITGRRPVDLRPGFRLRAGVSETSVRIGDTPLPAGRV